MPTSSGVLLFLALFVLEETYAPVLLRKRQHKRQHSSQASKSLDIEKAAADRTQAGKNEKQVDTPDPTRVFGRAITRPLRFLVTSPILVIFGFFLAVSAYSRTQIL
jgi:DHA1 family multidrug resistance protein-like MFS transporter